MTAHLMSTRHPDLATASPALPSISPRSPYRGHLKGAR